MAAKGIYNFLHSKGINPQVNLESIKKNRGI